MGKCNVCPATAAEVRTEPEVFTTQDTVLQINLIRSFLLKAPGRRPHSVRTYTEDVNGSVEQIAGISNKAGNVVGLMPHPERATDPLLGSTDGQVLLRSFIEASK